MPIPAHIEERSNEAADMMRDVRGGEGGGGDGAQKPDHVISMPVSFTELPSPVGGFHRRLRLLRSNSDPDVLSKPTCKDELEGQGEYHEHQLVFEERVPERADTLCRSVSQNDLLLATAERTEHAGGDGEPPAEVSLETAARRIEELIGPEQQKPRGHHRPLLSLFKELKKQASRKRVFSTNSTKEEKELGSGGATSAESPIPPESPAGGGRKKKFLGRSRSLGPKKAKEEKKAKWFLHEPPSESSLDKEEEGETCTPDKTLPSTSSSSSSERPVSGTLSERPVSGTPSEPPSTPEM